MMHFPPFSQFEEDFHTYCEKYLSQQETPKPLAEVIKYSLLSPGKRFRPRLFLACSQMLKLPYASILPGAIAMEMAHCFTLIHDDLPCMDNDDFRRGRASSHKKFGESQALLAGDSLMALAFHTLLKATIEPSVLLLALKRLAEAIGPKGVIGGQILESLLTSNSPLSELQAMHQKKTGALFRACVLIPKDFSKNVSKTSSDSLSETLYLEETNLLSNFADHLGLAFQTADDLEDQFQKSENQKPTNILFYLPFKKAQRFAIQRLKESSLRLLKHWGEATTPLIEISEELQHKIYLLSDTGF